MTSLLTQVDITSQLNLQQQAVGQDSTYIPKLNDIIESHFSNQAKPSSLLAKRFETTDFGDLLTKRVKTQSTNISENGSLQQSPTAKKNNQQDKIYLDDSLSAAFTRCSSSESANGLCNQDSFSASPVVIEIDSQAFLDDSTCQLQQALDLLREKMVEQDAQNILEFLFKVQISQEPLYIPPLIEEVPKLNEVSKKQAKKAKKIEIEDATYGAIEYPFLSFSTPFPENGDLTTISIPELSQSLTCNDPYLNEKVPAALSNLVKTDKKSNTFSIKRQRLTTVKSPSQESTTSDESSSTRRKQVQTKDDKKTNGKKIIISKVIEPVVQKKSKENEKDRKMEKEAESPKTGKQEKDDNIYSRPTLHGKRFTRRTKNKWQIAQDEKVKDIVLPALNFNGGYELFFSGNKKKAVPIGDEYQIDVSVVVSQNRTTNRKKPQIKWNPSLHCEGELKKFFNKVGLMMNGDYNQEKVVNVILDNKNDLKKALKYITANKSKCLETLRG